MSGFPHVKIRKKRENFIAYYRLTIRRFRDRFSPGMEVILVFTHSRWWDKANILYMEYVVYICFRMSFAYFAVISKIFKILRQTNS